MSFIRKLLTFHTPDALSDYKEAMCEVMLGAYPVIIFFNYWCYSIFLSSFANASKSFLLSSAELFLWSKEEFIYDCNDFEAILELIFPPIFEVKVPEKSEHLRYLLFFATGV